VSVAFDSRITVMVTPPAPNWVDAMQEGLDALHDGGVEVAVLDQARLQVRLSRVDADCPEDVQEDAEDMVEATCQELNGRGLAEAYFVGHVVMARVLEPA